LREIGATAPCLWSWKAPSNFPSTLFSLSTCNG
jgi:hypothetical protein